MKYIFKTLEDIRNSGISDAGNKAYNLALIKPAALNTLPGIVLLPDKNGKHAGHFIEKIKPSFDFPWILRSSAQNEDSEDQSFAGIYKSVIINNAGEFSKAIKEFEEPPDGFPALNPSQFSDPAVLIQPYIIFEKAGVMFIPDPWSGKPYCAEAGKPHEITDGTADKTLKLSENEKKLLNDAAKTLQTLFPWKYIDTEWGIYENKLFILQVRPLNFKRESRYEMENGVWIRDAHHNPEPLSPAHESLIQFISSVYPGYLGVYRHRLYYAESPPGIMREHKKKSELLPEDISEILYDFAKFTINYISAPEKPGSDKGKNLLSSSAGLFRKLFSEKHGKPGLPAKNIIKKDELFVQLLDFAGNLPLKWDISSPVIKEKPDLLASFLLKYRIKDQTADESTGIPGENPFKNNKNISPGELDDIEFANELYKIRKIFIQKGKELVKNGKISELNDIFYFKINELHTLNDFSGNELKKTLNIRKQLIKQKNQTVPDKLTDGKPVYNQNPQNQTGGKSAKYKGFSLTRGKVTGIIRKVESATDSPAENENTILVLKSVTPGDMLYIAGSAGFITESAIKTSHAVIAALELDIPAIAGIVNASEIPEGSKVFLDADNGFLETID